MTNLTPGFKQRPRGMSEETYLLRYKKPQFQSVKWAKENFYPTNGLKTSAKAEENFSPLPNSKILKIRKSDAKTSPPLRKAIILLHGATSGLSRADNEEYLNTLFGLNSLKFQKETGADLVWCSSKIEGVSELALTLNGLIDQDKFYVERGQQALEDMLKAGYAHQNLVFLGHSKGAKQAELLRRSLEKELPPERAPTFVLNAPIADGRTAAKQILKTLSETETPEKVTLLKAFLNGGFNPEIRINLPKTGAFHSLSPVENKNSNFKTYLYAPYYDKWNISKDDPASAKDILTGRILPKIGAVLSPTPGEDRDFKDYKREIDENLVYLKNGMDENLKDYKDLKKFIEFTEKKPEQKERQEEKGNASDRYRELEKITETVDMEYRLGRFLHGENVSKDKLRGLKNTAAQAGPGAPVKEITETHIANLRKHAYDCLNAMFPTVSNGNMRLTPSSAHVASVPIEDWKHILGLNGKSDPETQTELEKKRPSFDVLRSHLSGYAVSSVEENK